MRRSAERPTPLLPLRTAGLAGLLALCVVGCSADAVDASHSDGTGGLGSESGGSTGDGGESSAGGTAGSGGGATKVPPVGQPVTPAECKTTTTGSRLLRRLTQKELLNTHAEIFGGAAEGAVSKLPGDSVDHLRLSNDAAILLMGQDAAQALLDRAEEIADAVTEASSLATTLPCSTDGRDEACAEEFIGAYGEALFRRPLNAEEISRYRLLFQSINAESDFATGLKWVLVGLIQSPHAVYRSEIGDGGTLTPYELASELSYNYSASPPTAELVARALDGELNDPEVRVAEAKKLLMTPRGSEVVRQFFEEWLSYRDVLTVSRSRTPDNFEAMRPKMVKETESFIDALVFDKGGLLTDLLTADFTVADQELAAYYGFSGGSGDLGNGSAAEVTRDWGLGVFAQGSVTTAMASISVTSPTRRGLLLLRRLYCAVPGAPEALNFDLTDEQVQGNTTRERLERSHLKSECAGCHSFFDPLGFGFEEIDHVGRYRTEEVTDHGNFPIDATATVATLDNLEIDGQEELMRGLAEDPAVLSCVSNTLVRYVYGSDGTCRAPESQARVMSGDSSIVDFLAELAREPHFTQRSN